MPLLLTQTSLTEDLATRYGHDRVYDSQRGEPSALPEVELFDGLAQQIADALKVDRASVESALYELLSEDGAEERFAADMAADIAIDDELRDAWQVTGHFNPQLWTERREAKRAFDQAQTARIQAEADRLELDAWRQRVRYPPHKLSASQQTAGRLEGIVQRQAKIAARLREAALMREHGRSTGSSMAGVGVRTDGPAFYTAASPEQLALEEQAADRSEEERAVQSAPKLRAYDPARGQSLNELLRERRQLAKQAQDEHIRREAAALARCTYSSKPPERRSMQQQAAAHQPATTPRSSTAEVRTRVRFAV